MHDLFAEALFGDTPLGRLDLGTVETITPLTRGRLDGFYRRRYATPSIVVAAAGSLDHAAGGRAGPRGLRATRLGRRRRPAPLRPAATAPRPRRRRATGADRTGDTEQAHLVLGCPGIGRLDERRFAARRAQQRARRRHGRRLFQEIREKRGLAYSVYSYATQYADTGAVRRLRRLRARARCTRCCALIRGELGRVAADGHHRRGGGPRQGHAQGRSWCWAWRTPARG